MSDIVLLVSLDKLTVITALSPNLDVQTLRPNLIIAQEQVRQILGDLQYNHIVGKIRISDPLTTEELALMAYIEPFLMWEAAHESTINIYMKMVNNGITTGTDGEGRRSVNIEEVKFLRSMLTNRVELYRRQLQEYIRINLARYPLIAQSNSNQVVMSKRWQNYFAGIHLDSKVYRGVYWKDLPRYSELDHTDPPNCDW